MFTQKPNNNPFLLMKLKSEGKNINGIDLDEKLQTSLNKTQLSPEVDQQLKTALKVPKDKWTVPQTSNQQFGWFSDVDYFLFRKLEVKVTSLMKETNAIKQTMLIATIQ